MVMVRRYRTGLERIYSEVHSKGYRIVGLLIYWWID